MNTIAENLQNIKSRIEKAAKMANRSPDEIILVGATKGVCVEKIRQAQEAGLEIVGENYVQEALKKYQILGGSLKWHFIGHLQTNKVKYVVPIFELIQTVDSLRLAQEINRRAEKLNKIMPILLEVNTSQEASKFGISPQRLKETAIEISKLPYLKILGLMTMGFFSNDPEATRPCFRLLKKLSEELIGLPNIEMKYLSMGMTADFEVAITEGANIVRIGTGIFGQRAAAA